MQTDEFPEISKLRSALIGEGLPSLQSISFFRQRGPVRIHRLSFEGNQVDLFLKRMSWHSHVSPFQNEFAAIQALQGADLPCPQGYRILPFNVLPEEATLCKVPNGIPGHVLIQQSTDYIPPVLRFVGKVMSTLRAHPVGRAGTRGDCGRFVPLRGKWKDEWRALAEAEVLAVRRLGYGNLPVCQQLWARIEEALEALSDDITPALVHCGLGPKDLFFTGQGTKVRLTSVEEWGRSMVGDPLVEWASLMWINPGMLRHVFNGYGVEQARELLTKEAIQRLDLYAATSALSMLREAGERMTYLPSPKACLKLSQALNACKESLEPGRVQAHLDQALSGSETGTPVVSSNLDPVDILYRGVGHALGVVPTPTCDRIPYLLSAISCGDLAGVSKDATAQSFLATGHRFLGSANLRGRVLDETPIDNHEEWQQGLVAQVGTMCQGGGPALSAALLAAGLRVKNALNHQIPDRSLRGFESLVGAMLAAEAPRREGAGALQAKDQIVHGILGKDAAISLGLDGLAQSWSEQIADGIDVVSIGQSPILEESPPDIDSLLPIFAKPMMFAGRGMFFFPFASALYRLSKAGLLKEPPSRIVAMCFGNG